MLKKCLLAIPVHTVLLSFLFLLHGLHKMIPRAAFGHLLQEPRGPRRLHSSNRIDLDLCLNGRAWFLVLKHFEWPLRLEKPHKCSLFSVYNSLKMCGFVQFKSFPLNWQVLHCKPLAQAQNFSLSASCSMTFQVMKC